MLKASSSRRRPILAGITTACLGLLFYASGNFGLTNVLGVRREVQLVLAIPLIAAFVLYFPDWSRRLWNPVMCLSVALICREAIGGVQVIDLVNMLMLFMVAQIILGGGVSFNLSATKCIVCIAAIFSVMGLIEAVIFYIHPEFIALTNRPYESDTGAATIFVSHPIEYLGFNAAGEELYLFGRLYTRLNSFASEPSVLIATLLVPAFLGLTLTRWYRFLGVLILLFAVGPVESGTIWFSCFCGGIMYLYLTLMRKMFSSVQRYSGLILILLLIGSVVLLQKLDVSDITTSLTSLGERLTNITSTLASKGSSSTLRVGGMQEAFLWVISHPAGSIQGPDVAGLGLVFSIGYLSGYVGIGMCVWMYIQIFQNLARAFISADSRWTKLGICGCGGALLQAFFFSGLGWITPAGFIIFTLLLGLEERLSVEGNRMPLFARRNFLPNRRMQAKSW
jgi:hypothetical protein